MNDGTLVFVAILPYPWPPQKHILILRFPSPSETVEIIAGEDGKLRLTVTDKTSTAASAFTSQRIVVEGDRPRPVQAMALWDSVKCWLRLSEKELLPDSDTVPAFTLAALTIPLEHSFDNPAAIGACSQWIANRQAKFAQTEVRSDRRIKTPSEEAESLRSSSLRLKEFRQGVLAGKQFLLGTLAGELRALIYWPPSRDSKPDSQWNPLLLRMANKASLPLPVYAPPDIQKPPIIGQSLMHLAHDTPRINAIFPTDQVCDLQDNLKRTILRIGITQGRSIIALELIKELAHTLGAAHYDADASVFSDAMRKITQHNGDQVNAFICNMAETVELLSDWVISELEKRKLTT